MDVAQWIEMSGEYQLEGKTCRLIPLTLPSTLDQVKDFQLNQDDVIIASYPKTGTHWVARMCFMILNGYDASRYKDENARLLEMTAPFLKPPAGLDFFKSQTAQRMIITHLHSSFFRKTLDDKPVGERSKFVVIQRDPRDILVSMMEAFKKPPINLPMTWDLMFEMYEKELLPYGDPIDWINTWRPYANQPNVLLLTYEDMKADHAGTVRKLAHFLGKQDVSDEEIERVVGGTTVTQMAANPETNKFVRKGVTGDWKNYFTEEQIKRMDQKLAEKIKTK